MTERTIPADQPEALLTRLGEELARELPPALSAWTLVRATAVAEAWSDPVQRHLTEALAQAVMQSAGQAAAALATLAGTDVDGQRTTPLQIVRDSLGPPTAVLAAAGVPAVVRDRFSEQRFPGDPYDLAPASLAALGQELGALGLAWGAAKAAAHRARHQGSG